MQDHEGARIVVVEDDPSTAEYVTHVLRALGGYTVDHYTSPFEALAALEKGTCQAIVTDVMLPGIDGVEFFKRVRTIHPDVPVIIMTAYATLDVALDALQLQAAGFLRKPFTAPDLLERLASQLSVASAASQRVLAIGAHPDDVEIGAGATLAAHARAGDHITIAVMSHGFRGGDGEIRLQEAERAADMLNARLHVGNLEDTHIPEGGEAVSFIEELVALTKPTIVYTHSLNDVHQDHRNTHRASLVAARRTPAVYCYQSPSATVAFAPTRFLAVDDHLDAKLDLVAAHSSQASKRSYMDPELIRATSRYWGRFGDTRHAEAFEVIRERATQNGGRHVAA